MRKKSYDYKFNTNSSIILNLIRSIACQLVVIGHGISFMGIALWLHEPNFPWIQNIAVVIFFILSGILITHTTMERRQQKNYTFKNFFVDRFVRIYSVYLPCLIFVFVIDGIVLYYLNGVDAANSYNLRTFVLNLFMLQNYPLLDWVSSHFSFLSAISFFSVTSFGSARVNWTLSIEWWFYLFFGWLMLGATTIKNKIPFYLLMLVFSIAPIYLMVFGIRLGIAWVCGCLIMVLLNARLYHASEKTKLGLSVLLFVLAFARIIYLRYAYDPLFYVLLAFSIFFLIDYTNSTKKQILVNWKKVIDRFASYSFTLFLIHYSIFNFLVLYINDVSPYLLFVIGFMSSNIIAFFMAYFFEMRYRKFRDIVNKKFNLKAPG
jgi:peptidoglycan/LPS O-acetylase OafA/YrhL